MPEAIASTVSVRPVVPGDLAGLDSMLSALDGPSRYRRWFSGATHIHRAAAWAAQPDADDGVGLVATTVDGAVIGHAALIPIDGARAEVCFEVAAPWRQHGVAGRLLDQLVRSASERSSQRSWRRCWPRTPTCLPSCASTEHAASVATAA